jgi:hypothetical protein
MQTPESELVREIKSPGSSLPGLLALCQWALNDTARYTVVPDKISLSNLILFPDAPSCASRKEHFPVIPVSPVVRNFGCSLC